MIPLTTVRLEVNVEFSLQHQAVRRHGTAWAESLRYRKAEFEGMGGLRRITLNGNILIGDQGAAALARELGDDLWVKGQTSTSSMTLSKYICVCKCTCMAILYCVY